MKARRKAPKPPVRYYAIVDHGTRAHIVDQSTRRAVCGIELSTKGRQVAFPETELWKLDYPVCANCDRMKDADTVRSRLERRPDRPVKP